MMGGIETEVARSTVLEEITDDMAVSAAIMRYLRHEKWKIAFTTIAFEKVRAEGTTIVNAKATQGVHIFQGNLRHKLSRRELAVEQLSNTVAKADQNVPDAAITDAIRLDIIGGRSCRY